MEKFVIESKNCFSFTSKRWIWLFTSAKEVMFLSLFVRLQLCAKNFQTDLHEIFREGFEWTDEQMIKFWWRSGSGIWIWIGIQLTTLVRRVFAEVCTVLLLVWIAIIATMNSLRIWHFLPQFNREFLIFGCEKLTALLITVTSASDRVSRSHFLPACLIASLHETSAYIDSWCGISHWRFCCLWVKGKSCHSFASFSVCVCMTSVLWHCWLGH